MAVIDFSKPAGGLGEWRWDWNPGDPTPFDYLKAFYPDQPVNELHFAATDGVRDCAWFADKGLILQFRADTAGQHWGIFIRKPGTIYQFRVVVSFDLFYAQQDPAHPIDIIGSVGAVATSAKADSGHLGPPYGISDPDKDDLNIGGTCAFSSNTYDPMIRLNAPGNLFLNPDQIKKPAKTLFRGAKSGLPDDFWKDDLNKLHTTPWPTMAYAQPFTNNCIDPIILDVTAMPGNGNDPSIVNMKLMQAGNPYVPRLTQTIENVSSKQYKSDWSDMRYAGVAVRIDDTPDLNLGPIMVRITRLEVEWTPR